MDDSNKYFIIKTQVCLYEQPVHGPYNDFESAANELKKMIGITKDCDEEMVTSDSMKIIYGKIIDVKIGVSIKQLRKITGE